MHDRFKIHYNKPTKVFYFKEIIKDVVTFRNLRNLVALFT